MKIKFTKVFIPLIILIIVSAGILIWAVNRNGQSIYIDEDESYLSEFNVIGNDVQIVCHVTVCNTYGIDKTILIKGDFSSEVENGLISEKILYAVDSEKNKCQYTLQPHEKKSFDVIFIGTFAGEGQMTNRQLPPISIEEA